MYKPSYELCASVFAYDPDTGIVSWERPKQVRIKPGTEAGCIDREGYRRINFQGGAMAAHRLAWLLHYGEWPDGQIDHINRIRNDNRIANLRVVTSSQNAANREYRKPGQMRHSGTGISFNKSAGKWQVQVHNSKLGKPVYGGLFPSKEAALEKADAMRRDFDL